MRKDIIGNLILLDYLQIIEKKGILYEIIDIM